MEGHSLPQTVVKKRTLAHGRSPYTLDSVVKKIALAHKRTKYTSTVEKKIALDHGRTQYTSHCSGEESSCQRNDTVHVTLY